MTEDMRKSKSRLKVLSIAWGINAVYTMTVLWFYFYFKEIGHWSHKPLEVMMAGGLVIKTVLSFWMIGAAALYHSEKDQAERISKIMDELK